MKISTIVTTVVAGFLATSAFSAATYTIKVTNGGMQNSFSQAPPPPDEKGSFFARIRTYPYGHSTGSCSPIACTQSGPQDPVYTTVKPLAYGQSETLTVDMTKGPSWDPKTMILFNVGVTLYTSKESNGYYYYTHWRTFTQNGLPKKISFNTNGPTFSPSAQSMSMGGWTVCNSQVSWQECQDA